MFVSTSRARSLDRDERRRRADRSRRSADGPLGRAHLEEREQERERRLRPLVFVHAIGMEPIAATARDRIVERQLELVLPEEPIECAPRTRDPDAISRELMRVETRRDRPR